MDSNGRGKSGEVAAAEITRQMIARLVRIGMPPRLGVVETGSSEEHVVSVCGRGGMEREALNAISAVRIELPIVEVR
jgi:hypothetical protein